MTSPTVRQAPRRAHGAGTVRERKPGVWELRAFVGTDPSTGKPRQISRTFRGGKRAAEAELTKLKAEVAEGHHGGTSMATFARLLDDWLVQMEARGRRRTTVEKYKENVERHIKPALGHIRLKDLGPNDLDRFYTAMAAKKLSANSIRFLHANISTACAQGVRWRWISANPAAQATPPTKEKRERPTPSVEQVKAMTVLSATDVDMTALLLLAALLGARRGELCGLRWSDVDWSARAIHIARALVPVTGAHILVPPKGGKPRTEPLSELGTELLRRYRLVQIERCEENGADWSEDHWMFSLDGGTTHVRPKGVSSYVTALAKRAGCPAGVVLHSLRHWAGTTLNAAGHDPRTIADLLGHSRTSTTMDIYVRALPEKGRAAAEYLGSLLELPAPQELPPPADQGRELDKGADHGGRGEGSGG